MTSAQEIPQCPSCGTPMRPAGSTFVCEGCGSVPGVEPEDRAEKVAGRIPSRPRYKRIRRKDSWLRDRYDMTKEETQEWEEAGMPAHVDIIGGFLATNNFVYGVPDKAEVFRLDDLAKEQDRSMVGPESWTRDTLDLHYVQPSPIPVVSYTMAYPPLGMGFGDIVEVNYNVRVQGLVRTMHLTNIRVESGSRDDDDPRMAFLGTEYPGSAMQRRIRVVRITVKIPSYGTWETVSDTHYPRSIF